MIYIASIQSQKFIKVGYADNVQRRLGELQAGCPYQITALAICDGTLRQELSLHAALRQAFGRIRIPMPPNEWYPGKHPIMRGFTEEIRLYGFAAGYSFVERFNPSIKQPGLKKGGSFDPVLRWPK